MEPVVTTRWAPDAVEQRREIEDFDAVVRLYWPKVFRFALASLRDRDAAESLAQYCFLKAYRASGVSWRGQSKNLADADCGESGA